MKNNEIDFLQNAKERLNVLNEAIKRNVEIFELASSKEKQSIYSYIVSNYGTDGLQKFTTNIEDLKEITRVLDELL